MPKNKNFTGSLFLVVGPSGAGKDTLAQKIVQNLPNVEQAVSVTTRPQREGEVDGIHYFFVDHDEFKRCRDNGELLEEALVFGNYYGLFNREIQDRLDRGKDVVHVIDWQGARDIKFKMDCDIIYIAPPSVDVLRERLESRGQDDEKVIKKRMREAYSEMAHHGEADYLIINDDLEKATVDILSIARSKRLVQNRAYYESPPATIGMLDAAYFGNPDWDKGKPVCSM